MRFSCTQENLKAALSLIGHIASRQGSLPILSNVLMRADAKAVTLVTTNLEIAMTYHLRGKVEADGSVTTNAKLLGDVVNLLPRDRVDVEATATELKLQCRGSATKVRGMDAAEFPLVPAVERSHVVRVDAVAFRDALAQVAFAAATGSTRPELSGVLWRFDGSTATIAATDSYRLAERTITLAACGVPKGTAIIVPLRTVQELLRVLGAPPEDDQPTELTIVPTQSQLLAVAGNLEVVSRLVDATYPDYAQILPRTWQTRVRVGRSELQTAVRAASLFSRTGVNDVHLRCLSKEGQLIIRSENAQLGEHQAAIDAEVEGDTVETVLNARYLLDGLAVTPGDRVSIELNGAVAPVALRTAEAQEENQYLYIIMPIKQ
ncbi:MAG: DNA polymerase III subunit beta [bacterium]|nr:DNA polymerase III subunit beta [bacterium]